MWGSVSFSLLITLIHDFTALRRGRPAPLVAFEDGVSPFSPISVGLGSGEARKGGGEGWEQNLGDRLHLHPKKKSKLNGSDNLQTFLPAAALAFSIVHHPLHGHRGPPPHPSLRDPPRPAHAPAAPSRAFTDSQIIYGRVRGRGSPQCALEKTPYA